LRLRITELRKQLGSLPDVQGRSSTTEGAPLFMPTIIPVRGRIIQPQNPEWTTASRPLALSPSCAATKYQRWHFLDSVADCPIPMALPEQMG
jgi:hypothetical protein